MKKTTAFLIALLFVPISVSADSAAFDDSACEGYFEITSDNTKVDNTNDNLLYDLSLAPSSFWEEDPTAGNIRITNDAGDTAYSAEYENFSDNGSSGTGIVFFDSQNLETGNDITWRVYQCSGLSSPAPSDTLGSENVWNANYKGVWHMSEDPSIGDILDSTSNSNDATPSGTWGSGDLVTGEFGNGINFDNDTDHIAVSDNATLDITSAITIQFWANYDDVSSNGAEYGHPLSKGTGSPVYRMQTNKDESQSRMRGDTDGTDFDANGSTNPGIGVWSMYHGTYNSSDGDAFAYLDGSQDASDTNSSGSIVTDANDLYFGIRGDLTADTKFDGTLDEMRLLDTEVSANWISTEYNNQNSPSTFWTTGVWATSGAEPTPLYRPVINWFLGTVIPFIKLT